MRGAHIPIDIGTVKNRKAATVPGACGRAVETLKIERNMCAQRTSQIQARYQIPQIQARSHQVAKRPYKLALQA